MADLTRNYNNSLVTIAGGPCSATEVAAHEIIQQELNIDRKIYVLRNGLNGLIDESDPELARPKVDYRNILRYENSRGKIDNEEVGRQTANHLSAIVTENRINCVYLIGGDGSLLGLEECLKYWPSDSPMPKIVLLPKTIDNDVPNTITIGAYSAQGETRRLIQNAAHDVRCTGRLGVFQGPGRYSGRHVIGAGQGIANHILIPEWPVEMQQLHKVVEATLKANKLKFGQACGLVCVGEHWQPEGTEIPPEFRHIGGNEADEAKIGNSSHLRVAEWLAREFAQHQSILNTSNENGRPIRAGNIISELVRNVDPSRHDIIMATEMARMAVVSHAETPIQRIAITCDPDRTDLPISERIRAQDISVIRGSRQFPIAEYDTQFLRPLDGYAILN